MEEFLITVKMKSGVYTKTILTNIKVNKKQIKYLEEMTKNYFKMLEKGFNK